MAGLEIFLIHDCSSKNHVWFSSSLIEMVLGEFVINKLSVREKQIN